MSRYVAFLRGMNVGGHRLTNEDLRAHFESIGLHEVRTFRASGNVVFAAGAARADAVRERIEDGLASRLGYAVPTFVRTDAEVRAIAARQPFAPEQLRDSAGKVQVSLLGVSPARELRDEVLALAGERDALAFGERELYWLPSGGVLESALELGGIERLLGPSTMRTQGTIELLASKHCAG
jgi:uncharacterized protein (DUF1697 family)